MWGNTYPIYGNDFDKNTNVTSCHTGGNPVDPQRYWLVNNTGGFILESALWDGMAFGLGKLFSKGVKGIGRASIIESATAAKKGGESVVGHALQKHAGRNPNIWGKVKGSADQINKTALRHLEEIIDAPGDFVKVTNKRGVTFLEKKLSDGRGVRLNQDGTFKGFIDQ